MLTAAICAAIFSAGAYAQDGTQEAVRSVLKTMRGSNTLSAPHTTTTSEGYLKFIGAPVGNAFHPSSQAKAAGDAPAVAKSFLAEHGRAFGIQNDGVGFTTDRVLTNNAKTYVRLNQVYNGVPIFGAQVTVQMQPDGGIVAVLSDIMRDAGRVYSGAISLTPSITPNQARSAAIDAMLQNRPDQTFEANAALLNLYVPYVLGAVGQARLVYIIETYSTGAGMPADERILIDAHSGATVIRIPMILHAKNRTIYDAANVPGVDPGTLQRSEGDGPSSITDVDQAYDFYGDTYDFYFNEHNRDSIDNAGMTLDATTRYCPSSFNCPYANAFWREIESRMFFGDGFVVDDVVSHELTHGVTTNESGLIYFMESGAINESLSDIWGEFVDLTNGKGLDTPGVRWLMGEEVPGGAIRDMQHPNAFFCPDTYKGPFWIYDPNFDLGGVHINSGVSNKVCYLLTDGDTFNGFDVQPIGLQTVADLFYECQTNLLNQSSDYSDYGDALLLAGNNIGLGQVEIGQIANALYATRIKEFEGLPLRDFRGAGASGDLRIALTWRNPTEGTYTGVDIVRKTSGFPQNAADGVLVASTTTEESFVDTPGGGVGTDLYYGIFPRPGTFVGNQPLFARATIGVDVDYLTESYSDGSDMAFAQITFVPTGPVPVTGGAVEKPDVYFNYTTYAAHVSTDSKISPLFDGNLPVAREDAYSIAMGDDTEFTFDSPVPIPFFGRFLNSLTLSSNGFIAAAASQYDTMPSPSPTLEDHFADPRISFLYSDLDPRSGGKIWARFLDDRIAITFEDVPSFDVKGSTQPGEEYGNTVQCELFFGGQIRFTYLGLTAERAIIGLSDGNGVPVDALDVLAGNTPNTAITDLNSLPPSIPLELQPVPVQYIAPGDVVAFTATALTNQGAPVYSMIQLPNGLGVGAMNGATLDSATGQFNWNSGAASPGVYGMILCATAGQYSSCQTVGVVVTALDVLPRAEGIEISPDEPRDSQTLVLDYNYVHPSLPEGPTVIYWMKNGAVIPAFTNSLTLPGEATAPGDLWTCQVLPTTIAVGTYFTQNIYLRGDVVQAPAVTILPDLKVDTNNDGKVNSVDVQLVVQGLLGTGSPTVDADVNGDGNEDAADIQETVNYILKRKDK